LSIIWNKLIDCKDEIIQIFNEKAVEFNDPGLAHFDSNTWVNRVWCNKDVRRAHIDVIDARESKGLWMMHVCVFPVLTNDGPIYGFNVVADKNTITSVFHDFSASADLDNPMIARFRKGVADFIPGTQRKLSECATNIFSDKMLAASNVSTEEEVSVIIELALSNLRAYLDEISEFTGCGNRDLVTACQDYYCHNQQRRPHTPRTMKSLGLSEKDTNMLFPRILHISN